MALEVSNQEAIRQSARNQVVLAKKREMGKTDGTFYEFPRSPEGTVLYMGQYDKDKKHGISAKELSTALGISEKEAEVLASRFKDLDGDDKTFSPQEAAAVALTLRAKGSNPGLFLPTDDKVKAFMTQLAAKPESNEYKAARNEISTRFTATNKAYTDNQAEMDKLLAEKPTTPNSVMRFYVSGHDGSSLSALAERVKRDHKELKDVSIPRLVKLLAEERGLDVHAMLPKNEWLRIDKAFIEKAANPDQKDQTYWLDDREKRRGGHGTFSLALAGEMPGTSPHKVKSGESYWDIAAALKEKHGLDYVGTDSLAKILQKQVGQKANALQVDTEINLDTLWTTLAKMMPKEKAAAPA